VATRKQNGKSDVEASLAEIENTVKTRKATKAPAGQAAPAKAAVPAASPRRGELRLRLVRSGICTPKDQKRTLSGLGLNRIRQEVVRPDSAAIRGMVRKVRHLVEIVPMESR